MFQKPKCSECLNDDICPKNFSNEKKSPTKRAKVTKKKEPKIEIKTEPKDDALEPLTGNEKKLDLGRENIALIPTKNQSFVFY